MSSKTHAAVLDQLEAPLLEEESIPARGKMHAAVVEQFGKPLVLRELNIPSSGALPDSREDRGLRCVPHRSPRRAW
jgi:hypothetical protein